MIIYRVIARTCRSNVSEQTRRSERAKSLLWEVAERLYEKNPILGPKSTTDLALLTALHQK